MNKLVAISMMQRLRIAGLFLAMSLTACVGPPEILSCGNSCKEAGSSIKKLDWKGQCECYPPPQPAPSTSCK